MSDKNKEPEWLKKARLDYAKANLDAELAAEKARRLYQLIGGWSIYKSRKETP
jgi:hypothetical protein